MIEVLILPDKKKLKAEKGTDLLTIINSSGIFMNSTCAGEGTCGKCRVKILKGGYKSRSAQFLTKEEEKEKTVLACLTIPESDLELEIPYSSRVEELDILEGEVSRQELEPSSLAENIFSPEPIVEKHFLELSPPVLAEPTADFERVKTALLEKGCPVKEIPLQLLRRIPYILRGAGWKVTVAVCDGEIIDFEAGNRVKENYGIALDIGTTTLVAYLIDMEKQEVISTASSYNPQIPMGEDVITRIIQVEEKNSMQHMHSSLITAVNKMIQKMILEKNVSGNNVYILLAGGNTTMTHFFYKLPPGFIRRSPYVPLLGSAVVLTARELNIRISPFAKVTALPCPSAWVGGDIVAGVLASGIYDFSVLSMFVDLGTNGEVVIGNKDWLASCSTSAGPCFEGGGISSGIRAISGAIEKVRISNGKVTYKTIKNKKPLGICGSGLISLTAQMISERIIQRDGKFISGAPGVTEKGFLVVKGDETRYGKDIYITEPDIKNLINSKGAIFTGIFVLLKELGLTIDNIQRFYISGGLGTAMDIKDAVYIGLLPDIPLDLFVFLGNSSITGEKMCILSREAKNITEEINKKMTYIDLSSNSFFMQEYTASLFFPHTNLDLFPNVRKQYEK
ncbi:MAG: ASKHA domain-containing protein [Candidatus Omnitrophota bacterium]|nr:DUF4445 domain-containing protein [Candidatus Omnitrophota bacterium]MBU2528428.1 DUF4445 domain-containing protein [bacterium]MBU3930783.1 DUF4445 domain-containing protein [bacterium]